MFKIAFCATDMTTPYLLSSAPFPKKEGECGCLANSLTGIIKHFGLFTANDAISFQPKRSEVIALLGENGRRQETLISIMFSYYVAAEGRVKAFSKLLPPGNQCVALDVVIGMVHKHFTISDNMKVLENISLGMQSLWLARLNYIAARYCVEQLSVDFGLIVDPIASVSDFVGGRMPKRRDS